MNDTNHQPWENFSWVVLSVMQVESLLALLDYKGISPPFSMDSIYEALADLRDEGSCLRVVTRYHRIVHELLYTPPGQ